MPARQRPGTLLTPVPRPKNGFLETQVRLRRRGGPRWASPEGDRLWEWDELHGHIEGYNKRGRHIGVFDAYTGERVGDAIKGRKIDV